MLLVGLDTILRLLHPIMPFVTEEIWQHLRETAGGRQLPWDATPVPESIMIAAWPRPPAAWVDGHTEAQFGAFLAVVAAIREIRARQNVPPRTRVQVAIRAPRDQAALLQPLQAALESMATADVTAIGPDAAGAPAAATATAGGCEIFVDLAGLIDVAAEIVKVAKENEKTEGFIQAKRAKLADEKFAARAPEAVVAKERAQLAELEEKLARGRAVLADLRSRGPAPAG
jgi:valyl-tRNA synthetase